MTGIPSTRRTSFGLQAAHVDTQHLSVIALTHLDAIAEKKTARCFIGGIWNQNWRDRDFDRWIRRDQQATGPCVISTIGCSRNWKHLGVIVRLPGIDAGTDTVRLGNQLIANGYTMTLPQAEAMAWRTERGEKTGVIVGHGVFFPTETGDPQNPVSIGRLERDRHDWRSDICRLTDSAHEWSTRCRLLVRNAFFAKAYA